MGQKLQGFIIRKYRQERKWSQSSLCRGICAVSYLSKIEQGKAEGSPEVLTLLFRRLGIPWREDPAFCRFCGNGRRHIAAARFSWIGFCFPGP